jgi:integrase
MTLVPPSKLVPKGFNPCQVERFKEPGRKRQLEDAEIIRLGEGLKEFESEGDWSPFGLAAIRLYLLTWQRRDSIRTVRWEHVDWQNSTVTIHVKRRGLVKVRFNAAAMAVLQKLRDDFPDDGNPFVIRGTLPDKPYRNLQDPWNEVRTRAGLTDVRIHG